MRNEFGRRSVSNSPAFLALAVFIFVGLGLGFGLIFVLGLLFLGITARIWWSYRGSRFR